MRWYWNFPVMGLVAGMAIIAAKTASADTFDCATIPQQTKTNQVDGAQTTSSKSFVNVPGASVTFIADGGTCAIVEVSAQIRAVLPRSMRLRVTLDGAALIQPNFVTLYNTDNFDERAAIFILRNIAPAPGASHTLQVQFSSNNGDPVWISKILTIVHADSD